MRSRAEWRRGAEWLMRGAALGLLGWALYASAFGAESRGTGATTLVTSLDSSRAGSAGQLVSWTRDPELRRLHLALEGAPGRLAREWLRALDGAGTDVSWSGEIPAVAMAAEAIADPRGGVRVLVAAPAGTTVHIADEAGRIDSIGATAGGGVVRVPAAVGTLRARAGGTLVHIPSAPARAVRPVVVLGRAGWEAKFVVAALEEQGWRVTTRMQVAPGLTVGTASPALDTATVAAVIALDSTAARDAAAIARYVRGGGGLVLGQEAARVPAFGALVAGRAGGPVRGAPTYAAAVAQVTRATLPAAPMTALRPDAVALERRDGGVVLAARRVEAGRVVQLGYDETWRWRMAGGDDSPEAHRRWWSELVSAVAYAPLADTASVTEPGEAAPRAALVSALGMSASPPGDATGSTPFDPSRSLPLYIAVALLLCAEWASRRLRGAK